MLDSLVVSAMSRAGGGTLVDDMIMLGFEVNAPNT